MKFKKHKFISQEKLAQLLGVDQFNIQLYDGIQKGEKYFANFDRMHRTGYGQFAFSEQEELTFDIVYREGGQLEEKWMYLYKPLKELFSINKFSCYSNCNYTKIKPIYNIILNYSGELYDGSPYFLPSGKHRMRLVGILVK